MRGEKILNNQFARRQELKDKGTQNRPNRRQ